MRTIRRSWRWRNVPLPEPHLGVLGAGLGLSVLRPRPISSRPGARRSGWPLIATGIVLAAWATRSVAEVDLGRPDRLVTTGPYRRSRHPMYVAWALIYLGVALVLNAAWLVRLLPLLAGLIHREAQREEQRLEQTFGQEYVAYRASVRRYV